MAVWCLSPLAVPLVPLGLTVNEGWSTASPTSSCLGFLACMGKGYTKLVYLTFYRALEIGVLCSRD